jgi:hypothetical protein
MSLCRLASRIAYKMKTEDKYIKKQTLEASRHRLINIIRNYAEAITTIVDSSNRTWRKRSADERQMAFERVTEQKLLAPHFQDAGAR